MLKFIEPTAVLRYYSMRYEDRDGLIYEVVIEESLTYIGGMATEDIAVINMELDGHEVLEAPDMEERILKEWSEVKQKDSPKI